MKKLGHLINFGIENAESIPSLGTNAKMNEFEAAMGLCMLDEMEEILQKRKIIYDRYMTELGDIVKYQISHYASSKNYSYFPVIFKTEKEMQKVQKALNNNDIFPRRYFYPSLDTLCYIEPKQYCENSRDISKRILCLPFYSELTEEDQNSILDIMKKILKD